MMEKKKRKIPELLVPAGGYEQLRAAVANGADAVYLSGSSFNARINADNFNDETLADAVRFAHEHGVRVHVTLNTLIREEEREDAVRFAEKCRDLGADALILQDRGLSAELMRRIPDMTFHLSTQGTVYDRRGVEEAFRAGFQRVILSRELSLREIEEICRDTEAEIEVFVHGAVCIAYSGQCHMSYVIGGRSGNRGNCAQPCRLPYELSRDGERLSSPQGNCLLSPADMCLADSLSALIEAGVDSLKIEGRMKSPQYVAVVTSVYRKYLDLAAAGTPRRMSDEDRKKLLAVFNRGGMTDAYLRGESGASLMSEKIPKHQGIRIGTVSSYDAARGHISAVLTESLSIGDGIEVRKGGDSCGNIVTYLSERGNVLKIAPAGQRITIGDVKGRIRPGADIYRITHRALMKEAEESYRILPGRIPVRMILSAGEGAPAQLKISAPLYRYVSNIPDADLKKRADGQYGKSEKRGAGEVTVLLQSEEVLERALKRMPEETSVRRQLEKTGGTPYYLDECRIEITGVPMISASLLNSLRREGLEQLTAQRLEKMKAAYSVSGKRFPEENKRRKGDKSAAQVAEDGTDPTQWPGFRPAVALFFYETEQNRKRIPAVLAQIAENASIFREGEIFLDLYLPYRVFLSERKSIFGSLTEDLPVRIFPYLPAVTRGFDELRIESDLGKLSDLYDEKLIAGVAVSHRGQLSFFENMPVPVIAEENFHFHNIASVGEAKQSGIFRGVLSNELSVEDLGELLSDAALSSGEFLPEIAVYGRIPVMYTEHCVIGSHGPEGSCRNDDKKFYCQKGTYCLKDRKNASFPIIADCSVCRMEILSHKPADRFRFLKELCREKERGGAGCAVAARLYIYDESVGEILRLIVRTAASL